MKPIFGALFFGIIFYLIWNEFNEIKDRLDVIENRLDENNYNTNSRIKDIENDLYL